MAAALAIALRGTTTQVTAQLLIYPAVDFTGHYPSLDENIDGPIIKGGARTMSNVRNLYCPNEAEFTNPLVAPLHAKDHRNLPPAYIAVAEHDPLRDEGRAYAKVLIDASVPVVLDQGKSLFHGYLRSMGYSDSARARLRQMSAWLRSQ